LVTGGVLAFGFANKPQVILLSYQRIAFDFPSVFLWEMGSLPKRVVVDAIAFVLLAFDLTLSGSNRIV
jgi:hypothetical protein